MDGLFDDEMIEEVISDEEKEARRRKQAEHDVEAIAQSIFQPWVTRWYKGRYTQNRGHIVKVIKEAVAEGIHPDLVRRAMDYLGHEGGAITKLSLQFAIGQARKHQSIQGFQRGTDTFTAEDKGQYVEEI